MYINEGIIIKYKGHEPNEVTKNEIKRMAEFLLEVAPSESSIKATVVNAGDRGFTGTIRVYSSEGSFFTRARDESMLGLTAKLIDKIHRQIDNWKSVRFHIPNGQSKSYPNDSSRSE